MATRMAPRRARGSGGPAFADMFNAAEVMAVRPEDINARLVQQAFADGATLAELEQHLAFLRSLGAPDDAHPRVGVNDDYEVTMMICVVERATAGQTGVQRLPDHLVLTHPCRGSRSEPSRVRELATFDAGWRQPGLVPGGRDSGRAQSARTAAPHSGHRNGRRWATARQTA